MTETQNPRSQNLLSQLRRARNLLLEKGEFTMIPIRTAAGERTNGQSKTKATTRENATPLRAESNSIEVAFRVWVG